MNHSQSEIIRALLTEGSGASYTDPDVTEGGAWPLYVSSLPDGEGVEDNAGCLYDTEGSQVGRFLASGRVVEKPGFQLRIRSTDYRSGYKQAQETAEYLSTVKRRQVTISSNSYVIDTIVRTSTVLSLGQDERRQHTFTVNFMLMLL